MTSRDRARRARVLIAGYALWLAAFEIVGRFAATLPTVDLTSAWDRAIPVVPAFVWPYEACYLFPFAALFVIEDARRFDAAVVAVVIANVAAFGVYLAVPVAFPRPELGGSLSERVLALEYAADFSPGANNLPSMHVAMSWVMASATWGQRRRLVDVLSASFAILMTVTPLFVKQHLVLDVLLGVPWGLGAFAIARFSDGARSAAPRPGARTTSR